MTWPTEDPAKQGAGALPKMLGEHQGRGQTWTGRRGGSVLSYLMSPASRHLELDLPRALNLGMPLTKFLDTGEAERANS